MNEFIEIRGAKVNNLKDINLKIPRDKLVVVTGLSGSGKSSLAFDTIYAEGQRRYVESLSSYARQFLGIMEKPDVELIEGLSPAISIAQKTTSKNPRSTVGTVTEIYDYLRLMYARIGVPHCPNCGREIKQQSIDQIVDSVMSLGIGTKIQVLAPVIRGKKGEYSKLLEDAKKDGFVRARVDGIIYELGEDEIVLDKKKKHNIEIVVDRLVIKEDIKNRLNDSLETALKYANKLVLIDVLFNTDDDGNYIIPDVLKGRDLEYATNIANLSIDTGKKSKKIDLKFKEDEINFLMNIKNIGNICCNDFIYRFENNSIELNYNRKYLILGEKDNIAKKIVEDNKFILIKTEKYLEPGKVYKWRINILNSKSKIIMVGITQDEINLNVSLNDINGWYFYCYNSSLYSGKPHNYKDKKTDANKVINNIFIIFDMNKGNLDFILDNNKIEGYTDIPIDKPLYPSILLYDKNDRIEIIEC